MNGSQGKVQEYLRKPVSVCVCVCLRVCVHANKRVRENERILFPHGHLFQYKHRLCLDR